MWLNYHHLYYFSVIAREGGVSKAAKKLRLGQSTLSTQLGQLEEALGHHLFVRDGRNLKLSEYGVVAAEYAREIFRLGDELVDALRDRRTQGALSVQLGAVDSVPKEVVRALVGQARASQASVTLVEGMGEDLFRQLKRSQLDLVLASEAPPPGHRRGLKSRLVARLPVVVCGARRFARLAGRFPETLAGQPFILPIDGSRLRHEIDDYFRLHGLSIDVAIEAQDTSLRDVLAASGHGLVVTPEPAAPGLTVLCELAGVHEELWLVTGERRIDNPVAADLMRTFKL